VRRQGDEGRRQEVNPRLELLNQQKFVETSYIAASCPLPSASLPPHHD